MKAGTWGRISSEILEVVQTRDHELQVSKREQ